MELDPSKVGGAPSLLEIPGTGPIFGLVMGPGEVRGGLRGARRLVCLLPRAPLQDPGSVCPGGRVWEFPIGCVCGRFRFPTNPWDPFEVELTPAVLWLAKF